jgi:transposase IS66-like protein/transposase IS66 family protein
MSVQTVRRRLRLRSLTPALRAAFDEGRITAGAAEAAARLPDAHEKALEAQVEAGRRLSVADRAGRGPRADDGCHRRAARGPVRRARAHVGAAGLAHEFQAAVERPAEDASAAAGGGEAKAKELLRGERKAGGQPGHRGSGRELKPEDQVDEIVDHYPDACRGCGREFSADQLQRSRRFGRHQVADLPPITVIVREHRTHRLRCPRCRVKTTGQLPAGIGSSAFGPNLQAAVVTLIARNRLSRRDMAELARDLFGVTLSTGTIDHICQRTSDALVGPHLQLQDWVLDQGALHVDETGWRTAGDSRALWTLTSATAASGGVQKF